MVTGHAGLWVYTFLHRHCDVKDVYTLYMVVQRKPLFLVYGYDICSLWILEFPPGMQWRGNTKWFQVKKYIYNANSFKPHGVSGNVLFHSEKFQIYFSPSNCVLLLSLKDKLVSCTCLHEVSTGQIQSTIKAFFVLFFETNPGFLQFLRIPVVESPWTPRSKVSFPCLENE